METQRDDGGSLLSHSAPPLPPCPAILVTRMHSLAIHFVRSCGSGLAAGRGFESASPSVLPIHPSICGIIFSTTSHPTYALPARPPSQSSLSRRDPPLELTRPGLEGPRTWTSTGHEPFFFSTTAPAFASLSSPCDRQGRAKGGILLSLGCCVYALTGKQKQLLRTIPSRAGTGIAAVDRLAKVPPHPCRGP